jgi:hypothetical protein
MPATLKYPGEWLERVPAVVFACLLPGELRIIVHPGVGLADGGAPRDVPVDLIPRELRVPNTPLWLKLDEQMNIVQVWRRDE